MMRRNIGYGLRKTETKTMQTMNASLWMEKIGMTVINALLLTGIPMAMVAILIQAF